MNKSSETSQPFTTEEITAALQHRYGADETPTQPFAEQGEVIAALYALNTSNQDESTGPAPSLRAAVGDKLTCAVSPGDDALLAFFDECADEALEKIHLDDDLELLMSRYFPALAKEILVEGLSHTTDDHPFLAILDKICEEAMGWSIGLGRLGTSMLNQVKATLDQLSTEDPDYESVNADLTAFFDKERARIAKLEQRLIDSETGLLRAKMAKQRGAAIINKAMAGQHMTAAMVHFLQGPWYDSLQLLIINHGLTGELVVRACKLTETLVWTIQPIDAEDGAAKQRLYRIIEHLPAELAELLVALEHNADEASGILALLEQDHVTIVSGQELEFAAFEPIPNEDDLADAASVSQTLIKKVDDLQMGQWFLHEVADGQLNRVKLVLKLDDARALLFTNRSGMKALQTSFEEFAYGLSSGVITPLAHEALFANTIDANLQSIVSEHIRTRRLAKAAQQQQEEAERRRQEARDKAMAEAEALARKQEAARVARAAAAREEQLREASARAAANQHVLADTMREIKGLNIGAWLRLPGEDGSPLECKLAVTLASVDKYIFVNRTGVKMGEYTSSQLSELIAGGAGEILDTGVEFEDTLAKVVTGLRDNRNRSYDDLIGS